MKTLYLISKGMNKLPDEEIARLEKLNKHPRVSFLENALHAYVLDERFFRKKTPGIRSWIYNKMPAGTAQIIEALFQHKNYDVIFTQSERVGLPLALIMKWLGIKKPHVMIISRITSADQRKSRQKLWFLKHAKESISKILIWSSVQRNIAISEAGVQPEKIKLLKRGTDQKFWDASGFDDVVKDTICSVGMEMRDYPTLVEALRPLEEIPCHIAVGAARGQIFDTVKRLYNMEKIPDQITVGRKPYTELRALYARSRFAVVSLLPTDSDNGLTAILEAMAMGIPVICSRVEGQVDVIEEGITGLFVPQGDPKALREAILELWNDPERAKKMGQAARQYIEEVHNMEQFVAAIKREVIDSVASYSREYSMRKLKNVEM